MDSGNSTILYVVILTTLKEIARLRLLEINENFVHLQKQKEMFWIIGLIGFLVICWPYVLQLLAPVGKFILLLTYFLFVVPVTWILRIFRKPSTPEEEDKLSEDSTKMAILLLFLTIIGLLIWWEIRAA